MNIKEEFNLHIKDWQTKLNEDEWFFARLHEHLTKGLNPEDAFNHIPDVVDLVMEKSDQYLCLESFELLITLARISNTAEVHPKLENNWDKLIKHVSSFGVYHRTRTIELSRWYHKSAT